MSGIPEGFEEVIPEGFELVDDKKKKYSAGQFFRDAAGGAAGVADVAYGIPKMGVQLLGTGIAKAVDPSKNLNELWQAAGESIDHYAPTIGKMTGVDQSAGYKDVMYPFEKMGQGIDYVAGKVDNKDLQGAIKMGASVAPIPFLGKAGRGARAVLERVDPGLRKAGEAPRRIAEPEPIPPGFEEVKPEATPEAAVKPSEAMTPSQLKEWAELQQKYADYKNGELPSQKYDAAQAALEARQRAMEEQVARQTSLDMNAAERARQEQAPVPGLEEARAREVQDSINRTQELNQKGLSDDMFPYFGHDDPMGRMPEMRVDENGIPIRADLSMEAQNLQNPLQRNFWGDELGPALGQEHSLTDAMDHIPPWERNSDYVGRELMADDKLNEAVKTAIEEADKTSGRSQIGRGYRGKQSGAMDPGLINDIAESIRNLFKSGKMYGNMAVPVPKSDTVDQPRSDATIQARQEKIAKLKVMPEPLRKNFGDFDSPQTVEEAYWRAEKAGDISEGMLQKARDLLTSGLRYKAVMTQHPILQYFNKQFVDARSAAAKFSRDYITGKDGLGTLGSYLRGGELRNAMGALLEGDKHQHQWTREELTQRGFSEREIKFIEAFYKADKALLDAENSARRAIGLEEIRQREGHFPGIFSGSYKTIAMKDGKVVAVLSTDTVVGQKRAQEWIRKNVGDVEFVGDNRHPLYGDTKYGSRKWLGGNYNRGDVFSGMNDLIQMMAEHDPKFAEVQEALQRYIKDDANSLYGFNRHELEKKGVYGSQGNKPWESADKNAKEAFKAALQYFEEGAGHYNMQAPLNEARKAAQDYSTSQPHMSSFLDDYTNHITGDYGARIGQAINILLDAPFAAVGIGSRVPMQMLRSVKNTMSHLYMGYFNWAFTVAQYAQLGQSAAPFMALTANRLGVSPAHMVKAAGRSMTDFLSLFAEEKAEGKFKSNADATSRTLFKYAEERGMMNFSEMEKAQEATKNKLLRAKDAVAEFNMKVGEGGTRAPAFMTIARAMVDAGMPLDRRTMFIAENISQLGMIDYHPWERPRLYGKLGALGPFAGGLTTFKHGYASQQLMLAKTGRNGWSPITTSLAAMLTLAGIKGLPGYDEADTLVKYMTNKFGGKEQSIKDLALENAPTWASMGLLSDSTGADWSGKFSSSNMVPDTVGAAMSPHLEGAWKIGNSIFDMAANGADEQSIRNFVMASAPNGPIKGYLESVVSRAPTGEVIGKDGLKGYPRSEDEWSLRKSSGLVSTKEKQYKDQRFENISHRNADMKRLKEIKLDVYRRVVNGNITPEEGNKLYKEYKDRGGDPQDLVAQVKKAKMDKQLSQKNRDRGIPTNSISSIKKFKDFNGDN